jgi:hypothetical protein
VTEQLVEANGAFSVGPPKSAAGRRTVTLPAAVVTALAEHLANYTAPPPDAFVFLSSQGKHLRRSNFNRRVWQPATHAAASRACVVHDLRHTAGTLATAAGGSLREVMHRLGHSTTVAAVRYQHVMAERDAAISLPLARPEPVEAHREDPARSSPLSPTQVTPHDNRGTLLSAPSWDWRPRLEPGALACQSLSLATVAACRRPPTRSGRRA